MDVDQDGEPQGPEPDRTREGRGAANRGPEPEPEHVPPPIFTTPTFDHIPSTPFDPQALEQMRRYQAAARDEEHRFPLGYCAALGEKLALWASVERLADRVALLRALVPSSPGNSHDG